MSEIREETRARRFLKACDATRPGVGTLHRRGYAWLRDHFVPALEKLTARALPEDLPVLAANWDSLSAIHSLHGGYGPALAAALKTLELAPDDFLYHAYLASLYVEMGRWHEARDSFRRYRSLAPPGQEPPAPGLWCLKDDSIGADEPQYDPESWQSQVADALADFRPRDAQGIVGRRRSLEALLWRARAYGAMDQSARALEIWKRVALHRQVSSLGCEDWFYLPDALWQNSEFWSILVGMSPRLHHSWGPMHPSLAAASMEVQADSADEKLQLMFEFHLARTKWDGPAMCRLSARVPDWIEARKWAERLM